jgi:hypothetical protein
MVIPTTSIIQPPWQWWDFFHNLSVLMKRLSGTPPLYLYSLRNLKPEYPFTCRIRVITTTPPRKAYKLLEPPIFSPPYPHSTLHQSTSTLSKPPCHSHQVKTNSSLPTMTSATQFSIPSFSVSLCRISLTLRTQLGPLNSRTTLPYHPLQSPIR